MEEFAGSGQFEFVRTGYQTEGRLAFALAISEPEGGSDTMSMRTSARTIERTAGSQRNEDIREQRGVRALFARCGHRSGCVDGKASGAVVLARSS